MTFLSPVLACVTTSAESTTGDAPMISLSLGFSSKCFRADPVFLPPGLLTSRGSYFYVVFACVRAWWSVHPTAGSCGFLSCHFISYPGAI